MSDMTHQREWGTFVFVQVSVFGVFFQRLGQLLLIDLPLGVLSFDRLGVYDSSVVLWLAQRVVPGNFPFWFRIRGY